VSFDPIAAIEAAYLPAEDDSAWLRGLAGPLAALDLGGGVSLRIQEATEAGHFRTLAQAAAGRVDPGWNGWLDAAQRRTPLELLARFFWPTPPVRLARALARRLAPAYVATLDEVFRAIGIDESYGIVAGGPEGRILTIGAGIVGDRRLPPRVRHQLARVTAHLTTAMRLRARLTGPAPSPEDPVTEAVLAPDGAVAHAAGAAEPRAARESLGAAVRRIEGARGRLRKTSPEEALELWRGLVDGRWSLVDHHEADGRRWVLVRRNEPGLDDPLTLTPRERQVLAYAALGHSGKYVAYLLGLAPTTVSAHLAAACRKLGVRDRREAVALTWPGLGSSAPAGR